MQVQELKKILEEKKGKVLLLDVREFSEAEESPYFERNPENYIALPLGVLAVLPFEELATRIQSEMERLGWKSEETKIVTLCRSGGRSQMACEKLKSLGFDTESLDGGQIAWSGK